MSDEPDDLSRASADLDGELDDDARAAIDDRDGHDELVASLRRAREELADVAPPSDDARERAIAAALGVFDDQRAGDGAFPPPRLVTPPTPLTGRRAERARRANRWLAPVAAALVGVVAIGGAITMLVDDDGGDQSSGAPEASVLDAEVDNAASRAVEAAEPDDEDDTVDDDAAQDAAAAPAATPSDAAADQAEAPTAASTEMIVVRTDDELVDIARRSSVEPVTACDRDIAATVIDARTGEAREVLLAVEGDAGAEFVLVLAPEDAEDACAELDRVALP